MDGYRDYYARRSMHVMTEHMQAINRWEQSSARGISVVLRPITNA